MSRGRGYPPRENSANYREIELGEKTCVNCPRTFPRFFFRPRFLPPFVPYSSRTGKSRIRCRVARRFGQWV